MNSWAARTVGRRCGDRRPELRGDEARALGMGLPESCLLSPYRRHWDGIATDGNRGMFRSHFRAACGTLPAPRLPLWSRAVPCGGAPIPAAGSATAVSLPLAEPRRRWEASAAAPLPPFWGGKRGSLPPAEQEPLADSAGCGPGPEAPVLAAGQGVIGLRLLPLALVVQRQRWIRSILPRHVGTEEWVFLRSALKEFHFLYSFCQSTEIT